MNTLNLHNPRPIKQSRARDYTFIFENYELAFKKDQLSQLTRDWNDGMEIEQISQKYKRHEIEVLLALIFQATRNYIKRPFAYRIGS